MTDENRNVKERILDMFLKNLDNEIELTRKELQDCILILRETVEETSAKSLMQTAAEFARLKKELEFLVELKQIFGDENVERAGTQAPQYDAD